MDDFPFFDLLILSISYQSFFGAILASRRVTEGFKKSSPTLKVLSHEGSNLYQNITKNGQIRQKQGCCTGLQKFVQGQVKVFLGSKGHTWPGSIEKSNLSYKVWSHKGPTFFQKKGHILAKIPVLGNLTHI